MKWGVEIEVNYMRIKGVSSCVLIVSSDFIRLTLRKIANEVNRFLIFLLLSSLSGSLRWLTGRGYPVFISMTSATRRPRRVIN
ncbi:hypothetical protein KCP71_18210 [Salmonella enterica subsp. enterica]|nr:hypothetical protein KCP71_18210 [Salmonella enterica subsp. enterica]